MNELADELRRFHGLGAALFRAAAARLGMPASDLQAVDSLASTGPATPGQLADLTGLTTGAVTGMLKRLEDAGLVRRDADPHDARRVIVSLDPESDRLGEIDRTLHATTEAWTRNAADLDETQTATLLRFLERCNAASRGAIVRLREMPLAGEQTASSPVAGVTAGSLSVSRASLLRLRADRSMPHLYTADFDGPAPTVKTERGAVTMSFPRRIQLLGMGVATITLNARIPWRIAVAGAGSMIDADLRDLELEALEVSAAGSSIHLQLARCTDAVPVRISGGGSAIDIRREPDAPATVHLKGWGSELVLDGRRASDLDNGRRLQSEDYEPSGPHYAIELASSGSSVTIERNGGSPPRAR